MSINLAPTKRARSDRFFGLVAVLASVAVCSGCSSTSRMLGPKWVTDFATAERHHKSDGGAMVICYSNIAPGRPDPMADAVGAREVMEMTKGAVRCKLYRDDEQDRRYVAQFGVDRAPAMVVLHEDGTYHARTGLMSTEEILAFLDAADGGGAVPHVDPHIYRTANFDWLDDLEATIEASKASGQSALIVYHKWHGRDWSTIDAMLKRHEVAARIAGMVHCRRRVISGGAKEELVRWGVENLPAIVLVSPSGSFRVLELPESYEAIVRFVVGDKGESISANSPS